MWSLCEHLPSPIKLHGSTPGDIFVLVNLEKRLSESQPALWKSRSKTEEPGEDRLTPEDWSVGLHRPVNLCHSKKAFAQNVIFQ